MVILEDCRIPATNMVGEEGQVATPTALLVRQEYDVMVSTTAGLHHSHEGVKWRQNQHWYSNFSETHIIIEAHLNYRANSACVLDLLFFTPFSLQQ